MAKMDPKLRTVKIIGIGKTSKTKKSREGSKGSCRLLENCNMPMDDPATYKQQQWALNPKTGIVQ